MIYTDSTLLVDALLDLGDAIPPASGAYLRKRRSALRNAQGISTDFWWFHDWQWCMQESPATLLANTDSVTFTDVQVMDETKLGQLFRLDEDGVTYRPIMWKPLYALNKLRLGAPRTGFPVFYSQAGIDATGNAKTYLFWPKPLSNTTLKMVGRGRSPELFDASDPDRTGTDELFKIPADLRDMVIYEGALWKQMKDKGNIQSQTEQFKVYDAGRKRALEMYRGGKNQPHRIVPSGRMPRLGRGY